MNEFDLNARRELWTTIIGFYRDLIDVYGWHQEPMFAFTSWIAASPYAKHLFPSTSHESLGLSTVKSYNERLQTPMVYVRYFAGSGQFTICYQHVQGDTTTEEVVSSLQEPQVLERILKWVGVEIQV